MLQAAWADAERVTRSIVQVETVVLGRQGDTDFGTTSVVRSAPLGLEPRWWEDPAGRDPHLQRTLESVLPDGRVDVVWLDLGAGPFRVAWLRMRPVEALMDEFCLRVTRLGGGSAALEAAGRAVAVFRVPHGLDEAEIVEVVVRRWYRAAHIALTTRDRT